MSAARVYSSLSPFGELAVRGELRSSRDLARRALDMGLDGLELHPSGMAAATRLGIEINPRELSPLGLSLHSNHIDFNAASTNPFIREAAVTQLINEVSYAADHGIQVLTCHPGTAKKIERSGALALFWSTLEHVVDRVGVVRLCLENMDHNEPKLRNVAPEIAATLDRCARREAPTR